MHELYLMIKYTTIVVQVERAIFESTSSSMERSREYVRQLQLRQMSAIKSRQKIMRCVLYIAIACVFAIMVWYADVKAYETTKFYNVLTLSLFAVAALLLITALT